MDKIVLTIKLEKDSKNVDLILKRGVSLLDRSQVLIDRHFDHFLIEGVDKLLKRNRINPMALNRVVLSGHIDKNSSSHKMATAFLQAINVRKNASK
jgi:hypothetical protein